MLPRGNRRGAPLTMALGIATVAAVGLAGCTEIGASGAIPAPAPTPTSSSRLEPVISVVVVGDSLAAGGNDDTPEDPGGWAQYLTGRLAVTDGWWRNGATTPKMADNMHLAEGDVLVVMGGTNDAVQDIPVSVTVASVKRIAQKVEAGTVILCAIPPFSRETKAAERINEELEKVALESGWFWLDPWELYRDGENWTGDASLDGKHPNQPVYRSAGMVIAQTIEDIVG